jgi:hypothetical protein
MINKFWNLEDYNFGELSTAIAPAKPYSAATIEEPISL